MGCGAGATDGAVVVDELPEELTEVVVATGCGGLSADVGGGVLSRALMLLAVAAETELTGTALLLWLLLLLTAAAAAARRAACCCCCCCCCRCCWNKDEAAVKAAGCEFEEEL